MAQVQHAVAAMGGSEQAELRRQYVQPAHQQQQQEQDDIAAVVAAGRASCRIPLPNVKQPPQLQELLQQAEQQQQRRAAALQGAPFSNPQAIDQQHVQQQAAGAAPATGSIAAAEAAADGSSGGVGSWLESWPQLALGDAVVAFDELSAAKGSLGRFTGAGIMPLVKQFTGRPV
jgi:hypothetical protein